MEDLRSILNSHHSKLNDKSDSQTIEPTDGLIKATTSEIPDIFFDEVLVDFKLSRIEILLLMYLYRVTWCKPNLYKKYGIAPMLSHSELSVKLDITIDILHQNLRRLEAFGFIETIRAGQYFVRKYFTEENDKTYGQSYDDFL